MTTRSDSAARQSSASGVNPEAGFLFCRACCKTKPIIDPETGEENFYKKPRSNNNLAPKVYRTPCKPCYIEIANRKRKSRTAKAPTMRKCGRCHKNRPLSDFRPEDLEPRSASEQKSRYGGLCELCRAELTPTEEAKDQLSRALKQGIRWARAMKAALASRRLTVEQYVTLRGPERRDFDEHWTEIMRRMARKAGDWNPLWDDPNYQPTENCLGPMEKAA